MRGAVASLADYQPLGIYGGALVNAVRIVVGRTWRRGGVEFLGFSLGWWIEIDTFSELSGGY